MQLYINWSYWLFLVVVSLMCYLWEEVCWFCMMLLMQLLVLYLCWCASLVSRVIHYLFTLVKKSLFMV
jgi:hypothetical protein